MLGHQEWRKSFGISRQPVCLDSFYQARHIRSFCKDKTRNDRNEPD